MHIRQKVLPQLRTDNMSSTNFIYIQNSPVSEDDLKLIFEKYPPLQDDVPVEGMEEVYKYGQMEVDMKGIGSKIRQIIKES